MAEELAINVTIFPPDDASALRAVEALSRAAAGLALDGIGVTLSLNHFDPDEPLDDD